MKDLREHVADRILTEEAFNMRNFGMLNDLKFPNPATCGSACCIAGHIITGAAELGIPLQIETESPFNLRSDFRDVACVARRIWADAYGIEEANRLEFDEHGWGLDLEDVTAHEAADHLKGAPPVVHGHLWEND
jgi:hypothetical protein